MAGQSRPQGIFRVFHLGALLFVFAGGLAFADTSPRRDAAKLDREGFRRAFERALERLPADARPEANPELVEIVKATSWHAVHASADWLDLLDPEIEVDTRPERDVLIRKARIVASILEEAKGAPELSAMVERVVSWSPGDFEEYRAGKRAEAEADEAFKKGKIQEADQKCEEAIAAYRKVGRSDRADLVASPPLGRERAGRRAQESAGRVPRSRAARRSRAREPLLLGAWTAWGAGLEAHE